MPTASEPRLVDARGMLCPWPALRLARAAREMGGQGLIRISADDPVAPREIEAMCRERGWGFEQAGEAEFLVSLG